MDVIMFEEIIKLALLIYVLVTVGGICLFWFIISTAVKRGVKKALKEFYDENIYEEDFQPATESELSDWHYRD